MRRLKFGNAMLWEDTNIQEMTAAETKLFRIMDVHSQVLMVSTVLKPSSL